MHIHTDIGMYLVPLVQTHAYVCITKLMHEMQTMKCTCVNHACL